jgi:short-subunit dehydrogenase
MSQFHDTLLDSALQAAIPRPLRLATSAMKRDASSPLSQKVAVVTGASSGVGRSIAIALAREGADLALVGRRLRLLRAVATTCEQLGSRAVCCKADLVDDSQIKKARNEVMKTFGGVDILIHSAGVIARSTFAKAAPKDLDRQYRCNVRAPFVLTQLFLQTLTQRKGHIAFLNSTAGLFGAAGIPQYSATKHALRGLADSLREELNPLGVRVVSVFLGRTATPMQERVHRWEGKSYTPERLIQPEQVASVLINTLTLGPEAEITDVRIRPRMKPATV